MQYYSILRIVTKLLIPYMLLFGLYVQFHGDYGPGGGFQAGVIFAAGVILYSLVFGQHAGRRVVPPLVAEKIVALGVLVYAGTGLLAMFRGGAFLEYSALDHHHPEHGQHLGILVVELGVGMTVAAVMITIFFCFGGRERAR